MDFIGSFLLRGAAILLFGGLCLLLARQASAASRRLIAALSLGACLLLPLILSLPQQSRFEVLLSYRTSRIVTEALSSTEGLTFASPAAVSASAAGPVPWAIDDWAVAVWVLGCVLCVGRILLNQVRAVRLARRSERGESGQLYSTELNSPVVVGLFRPVIVLPVAARSWTAECLRSVLLHETAHVRLRDGLMLGLGQLCCAVYWPVPFAWLMLGRLRRECELAADETVLHAGVRASTYAEHLIFVARGFVPRAGTVAMATGQSELSRRVTALLSQVTTPKPLSRWHVATGLGATLLTLQLAAVAAVPASTSKPQHGGDARLQAIAADEAKRLHTELGAERVAIVVLSAQTSEVLAQWDDRPGTPVKPSSTLKPLVVASALAAGKIRATDQFDCGNGERVYPDATLRDVKAFGSLSTAEILERSSNIGISRIFDALGGEGLQRGLGQFGIVAPRVEANTFSGAVVAIGQRRVTSTPYDMAAAYAVFAAGGEQRRPGQSAQRLLTPEVARTMLADLELAVNGEQATGKGAQLGGVRVAGKTGTSDEVDASFATFVGIVPADAPRYVIYVGIGAKGELSGGKHAAPAFARVAQRALALTP